MKTVTKHYIKPLDEKTVTLTTIHKRSEQIQFELQNQDKSIITFLDKQAARTWCNTMKQAILFEY